MRRRTRGSRSSCVSQTELNVGRGDLFVGNGALRQRVTTELVADVACDERDGGYRRHTVHSRSGTREVRAFIEQVETRYDVSSGRGIAHDGLGLALNDLARIRIRTSTPIAIDSYRDARGTGSFLLVSPVTSETVGAGMVT